MDSVSALGFKPMINVYAVVLFISKTNKQTIKMQLKFFEKWKTSMKSAYIFSLCKVTKPVMYIIKICNK